MKTLTLVPILLASCLATAAAQDVFAHPLTERGRPEVVAIAKRMASRPLVTASFTQTKRVAKLNKTFVSRGRMIFDASRGLVWETKSPFPGTLLMTKDAIKQKTAGGKTSVLASGDNDTFKRFAGVMQAVFSGDLESIEKEFDIFYLSPAAGSWIIGLKPRDKTLASVVGGLALKGADGLAGISLIETSGDKVEYAFTDVASPAALGPADEKAFF